MMWTVPSRPASWLRLSSLTPERILDEYDHPRLFTVVSDDGQLLLAYQCAEEPSTDRFLLVPADEPLISEIEGNQLALRDALTKRGWAWLIDRERSGELSDPISIAPSDLPESALPKPGVRLTLDERVLLRVRMMGPELGQRGVPASVVKKAVDGATGAIRALSAYALDVTVTGRPAEDFRRYYDLPAVEFGFRSFEIAFGAPDPTNLQLDKDATLEKVRDLLSKGLKWAADSQPTKIDHTAEWESIIEALAKLAPPQTGVVESVDVSGQLTGRRRRPVRLTRASSERISTARREFTPDKRAKTYTGFITELDKDKSTFLLRDSRATTICGVSFTEEHSGDVYLAFDTEKLVTIVVYGTATPYQLTAITFATIGSAGTQSGSPQPTGNP